MNLTISELTPERCAAWDAFVSGHSQGTPFHLTAWKRSIEQTFRYRPYYFCALDGGGGIHGVLPLFLVQNFMLGKALLSSPFAVYGGILADAEEARRLLYGHAARLGERLGVEYIEYRNADAGQCGGEPNVSRYVSFSKSVGAGEEELLEELPKKTRNLVRKAMRFPFTVRRQREEYREFEALYSRNLRRLGTPSFPPGHFRTLLEQFGDLVHIAEVRLEDKVVAASFNFCFRGEMHTYYAASDPDYNDKVPNIYMYFDHLRWAAGNGFSTFDFGRCKHGTGVFEFKRHWGSQMRELPYEVVLVKRKELPNFSPANDKFRMAIKVWQRLPLPVTRAIGPQLIRLFP